LVPPLQNRGEFRATIKTRLRYWSCSVEDVRMKKTFAILATVAAIGTAAVATPAEARWRGGGWGPGIGFGLVAGALAAGAYGAYGPYGYYNEPYYGPRYRRAYYGPGPYGYYGPRYYGPRYYGGW
jgi:hypothetical protein